MRVTENAGRESFNEDDDIFSIDYSGTEARVRVREDWVLPDGEQMHFGCTGSGFTRIDVWSSDKDGIESIINEFFHINPIGEKVTIEPPVGLDDSENIIYID